MLQSTPWELLDRLSSAPGSKGLSSSRDERLSSPLHRASYAVNFRNNHSRQYQNGVIGEPCVRCATFTHSFCEVCFLQRDPPFAICTTCDDQRLVCVMCQSAGLEWSAGGEARAARGDAEEMVEISAFRDESGAVVRVNPPLRVPLSQVTEEHPIDAHLEAYLRSRGM